MLFRSPASAYSQLAVTELGKFSGLGLGFGELAGKLQPGPKTQECHLLRQQLQPLFLPSSLLNLGTNGRMPDPAEPPRKRRRPAVSCVQCRKRKIKCDRSMPCSNCVKATPPQDCNYDAPRHLQQPNALKHPVGAHRDSDSESRTTLCDTRSAIGTPASTQPVVGFLPGSPVTTTSLPGVSDAFYVQYDESQDPAASSTPGHSIPRLVSHKTRVFGQSHWISPCITLYGKDLIGVLAKTIPPQAFADLHRCKALARTIKARRSPPWPTMPTREIGRAHV